MLSARKVLQAAVLFLGLMLLVFGSAVVTMKVITYGQTVEVPGVVGKDVTGAIGVLKDAGLDISVERQEHHPSVPAGFIISQSPLSGLAVKRGRNVLVVVSLGSEEVTSPELVGEPLRRVQVALKQSGLTPGDVARAPSGEQRDVVTVQYPPGKSAVQKGAGVDLLVGDGPPQARYVMPELVGKSVAESESALRPMAVKVAETGGGKVVTAQEPKTGYPVASGGDVKLTLGPAPGAQPLKPNL
jgi:eukaryotic-like serine/threonine-protein kinase